MTKLDELIKVISKLHGIGKKSAIRIAFEILEKNEEELEELVNTIKSAYIEIKPCPICFTLTDNEFCDVCLNLNRDKDVICVVENTRDVFAFEKAGGYNGLYHVLGGKIDPLNGISSEDLNISSLEARLKDVKELILALNPDIEGETTSLYISRLFTDRGIKISKIASGIPMGGNIEFTDMMTLTKSLEGRLEIKDEI